jgi:hypothetical protein
MFAEAETITVGMHSMRALIISLAAAGFALSSLSGYAGGDLSSRSRLEQQSRVGDDEPKLRSAGASSKAIVRAIDEDAPLKSAGGARRPNRTADDDNQPLKSAGASRKIARAIDDDIPVKSAGASSRAVRAIDDDAPLKSAGAASTPGHKSVQSKQKK